MPYSRRNYRRPSYRPRRTHSRRRNQSSGYMGLASKALSVARYVKSLINTEAKHLDFTGTSAPNTSGAVLQYSALAQGTTDITRVGNSLKVVSQLHRFQIDKHVTPNATVVRLIIFINKFPKGTNATPSNVLERLDVLSPLNIDQAKNFLVLRDIMIDLNTDKPCQTVKFFHKEQRHVKFNGVLGTDANVDSGSLNVLFISDQATNVPTVKYDIRQRFIDN